jgi:crotonobetainyl-CoA:carnitine CoA-transferase CaiB-like acyl-CoA transferase
MAGPLAGYRVLDLSRILAGPWLAQLLSDLGAEVWKIERPGTGDDTRQWGPPFLRKDGGIDTTESAYFLSANRGKHSICVDISTDEGSAIVRALAQQADLVIENYKVGDMARYGLDYEALKRVKPDIIYCSITGYGQTGPMKDVAGYDMAIQAIGGLMSITGESDDKPGGSAEGRGSDRRYSHWHV